MQLVPLMGVPCRGDHASTLAVAEDLTVGEKSPVREPHHRGQRGSTVPTCGAPMSVAVDLKMSFSILQNCLNSVVFCLFCVELNRAPKIMKFFV